MNTVLEVANVEKYYGNKGNLTKALDKISFQVEEGEFVGIMGASGSGKTTLLNCLSTIDRITSGKIVVDDVDITRLKGNHLNRFRREELGFIFQDFNLIPSLNVWENIVLPIGLDHQKVDHNYVMEIVDTIGIRAKLKTLPNALSGGQKQRVAIARALASRPSVILADEPTGNLDSHTELEVIALLKSCVQKYGQTLVMITHDETIAQMADCVVVIEDGKVVTQA